MNRPILATQPPAIVLAAFGTTSEEGRRVYAHVLDAAREWFPRHDVFLAFTSRKVVKSLRDRGIDPLYLPETPAQLLALGHRRAVCQPLMIMPGSGYDELLRTATDGLQVAFGQPLLARPESLSAVVEAVAGDIAPGRLTIFVLHGTSTEDKKPWLELAAALEKRYPDTIACFVEGKELAQTASLPKRIGAPRSAHFVPLMMTAGSHMGRDVLGDDSRSLKNRMGLSETTCSPPLGCNAAILDLFFRHLEQALANFKRMP